MAVVTLVARRNARADAIVWMALYGWPHANELVWIILWNRIVQMYRVNFIV